MTIGFIGAGNMAFAIAGGIKKNIPDTKICIYDPSQERVDLFRKSFADVDVLASNREVGDFTDVTFLSVKPQIIKKVFAEISGCEGLFISIAAGVRLAKLEENLPKARVVRVMPNTPCLVGEMAAVFTPGDNVSEVDIGLIKRLLESSGRVWQLPEKLMDAVTALSGSGPAFAARIFEAFIEAAVLQGLPRETAAGLCYQTFIGTAKLLIEKDMQPEELVKMVSSPKGTTVAGREVLENSNFQSIIINTLEAAAKRSKELA